MKKKIYYFVLFIAGSFSVISCKKYLNAKPDQSLATVSSVADLQGFLDDYRHMNQSCSPATEIAADNYYLTDSLYDALQTDQDRQAYLWGPGEFDFNFDDWQSEYNTVYIANLVLDGLKEVSRTSFNASAWDYCKGSALLYRAKAFFEIAQIWAVAYDSLSAAKDMGIPLRLTSNFNIPSVRSNNKETYGQIIEDFEKAIRYLPNAADNVFRPTKAAAYGLLSRTFLAMRKYDQAKLYADSCLSINNKILDFNELDTNAASPFGPISHSNPEDILHSIVLGPSEVILTYVYGRVDSALYHSYSENDLRKKIYFQPNPDGSYGFKAAYDDIWNFYNGLATDEVYLNRAECLARQGDATGALRDLNALLVNRWKTGAYTPYSASDPNKALQIILSERRKELFYRMLRFTDIKRLNKEGANITLKRTIHGQEYALLPNEPRYARPIPKKVIELSGIQQN